MIKMNIMMIKMIMINNDDKDKHNDQDGHDDHDVDQGEVELSSSL